MGVLAAVRPEMARPMKNARASVEYEYALSRATAHHARSKTYSGKLMRPHADALTAIIAKYSVESILDYGCGKGDQYRWVDPKTGKTLEELWGIEVRKFDPAYPPYADEPEGEFDLVICTHVLGGIPDRDLLWVVPRLYEHARKAVFIAEKIGDIKKTIHGSKRRSRNSMQWISTIAPHRRAGIETHLCLLYRTPFGKFSGTFRL